MREQDEHVHRVEPAKRLDRGGARVTRGRADDADPVAAPLQRRLEHLPDQLHGEILERQRRAVEQFQQEMVRTQLHQRRAGVVAEPGISARDDLGEVVLAESVADERPHHPERDLLVGQPRQRGDLRLAELRHLGGHVEPAVAGQAGQHRLLETQFRRTAAGRDIAHGDHSFSRRRRRDSSR